MQKVFAEVDAHNKWITFIRRFCKIIIEFWLTPSKSQRTVQNSSFFVRWTCVMVCVTGPLPCCDSTKLAHSFYQFECRHQNQQLAQSPPFSPWSIICKIRNNNNNLFIYLFIKSIERRHWRTKNQRYSKTGSTSRSSSPYDSDTRPVSQRGVQSTAHHTTHIYLTGLWLIIHSWFTIYNVYCFLKNDSLIREMTYLSKDHM